MTKTLDIEIVNKVQTQLFNSGKRHRIIVGGRGKGASWSIARILLAEGVSQPLFNVCLREVQKSIEHSVKKLLEDTIETLRLDSFYRLTKYEINGRNGTKFIFSGLHDYNADNIKSLEGADRCWVAEAQTISRRSINILRPTIRKRGSIVWWDFNPRYETDPIYIDYILNNDPHAAVLWLNWRDNPWFTEASIQEKESDYLRNEEEAEHIWEGRLRLMGDKFVCPAALVDIAIKNDLSAGQELVVGADIAHQGGDEITFYKRYGLKVVDEYVSKKQNTQKTIRDLKAFTIDKSVQINIDNGDIGKAVADYLEEDGWIVNRINFGGKPVNVEHYEDTVTEMYFGLRDLLPYIDIPNNAKLRDQLIQRKYDFISGRRGYEVMKIESKDKYKEHAKSQGSSPDRADALVLCFYQADTESAFDTPSHNIF